MRKITKIVIHHSATPRDLPLEKSIASFDRTHKARLHNKANGYGLHIAYHAVGSGDGRIERTRPDEEVGYHAGNLKVNRESLGYCMTGNFDIEKPSKAQLNTMRTWVLEKCKKYGLKREDVFFHRDIVNYKTCPGSRIDKKTLLDFIFSQVVTVSEWAVEAVQKAHATGIIKDWSDPQEIIDPLTYAWIFHNLGVVKKVEGKGLTKEQVAVALDRLGLLG